jgi:hypothetical protein
MGVPFISDYDGRIASQRVAGRPQNVEIGAFAGEIDAPPLQARDAFVRVRIDVRTERVGRQGRDRLHQPRSTTGDHQKR